MEPPWRGALPSKQAHTLRKRLRNLASYACCSGVSDGSAARSMIDVSPGALRPRCQSVPQTWFESGNEPMLGTQETSAR
jgi:hypothetical protein